MAIPFLHNINLSNNELQNAKLHNTGATVNAAAGQIYFNTATGYNKPRVHDGTVWLDLLDTTSIVDGTYVSATLTNNVDLTIDISALDGAAAVGERYLTKSNTWAEVAAIPGTYTFEAGSDSGVNQTIDSSDLLNINGGAYLTGTISAIGTTKTISLDHDATTRTDTVSTDTPAYGGTFEAVTSVTTNTQGHVTAIDVSTITIPASDNTDTDVSVANLITRLGQISQNVTIGDAADVTVIIPGDLQVTGTTTTNNVETVSTSNGIVFEGNVADANELTLLAGTLTADRTITLPDNSGTVALTSDLHDAVTLAGSYDYITLTGQVLTLNQIDYTTDIVNLPTIPSPANNAIITLSAGTNLTGGGDFTTDQSANETIAFNLATADATTIGAGNVAAGAGISVSYTSGTATVTNTDRNSDNTFSGTIGDGISTSLTVTSATHGLGTNSSSFMIQLVEVSSGETVYANVTRGASGLVTIDFASAPATNAIRVLIQKIG